MQKQIGYVGRRKSDGKWYARVQVNGLDKTKWAKTEEESRALLEQLRAECGVIAITAPPAVLNGSAHEASAITFKTVADQYSAHKVRPAQYRNDRKIAGLRSERTARLRIAVLVEYFGEMPIDRITPATPVERFKLERLNTRTRNKTERQIASVNRELEQLRAILRYARNEGLITASPFERSSSPLISKADETKRTRVLSREEEIRLLKACETPERDHLIPLIIFAVDTGMRKGEMLSLTWADVNFKARSITVRATTTKTLQSRVVPISRRLLAYLRPMLSRAGNSPNTIPVFTLRKWQNGWVSACRDAKIDGLRWHDLRATFITRCVERGVPVELVAKISGHQDVATLYAHYLRSSASALDAVRTALDG
jgi:integrase